MIYKAVSLVQLCIYVYFIDYYKVLSIVPLHFILIMIEVKKLQWDFSIL